MRVIAIAVPLLALSFASTATADDPLKVVVVVAGDPDPDLREAASLVDRALAVAAGIRTQADPGLGQALRGEPAPAEDDGLGPARAARRKLGWGEERDLPVLVRIGHMAGATAIALVRRAQGSSSIECVVVDVGASAFYEGELALPAPGRELEAFVRSRARAAKARNDGPVAGAPPHTASTPAPSPRATSPLVSGAKQGSEDGGEEGSWFRRNWAYVVGGVLLLGVVIGFSVCGRHDDPGQPVLRFIPGGDS